ncbi:MAG: RdgB/HAM1 family non-canonical purine NTP pyrophosphatase [Bacteroidota bacterium]|jgi:XTP/dITP diphosphohydrolase
MIRIVLATRNKGKLKEISTIMSGLPVEMLSAFDFPYLPEVDEDGETLKENALKKARALHSATHLPALADDSGLEVLALDMRPGVLSARYAGENVSYEENNEKLLLELGNVPPSRRSAQFRCVAAFVGKGVEKTTTGICPGRIIDGPRGEGGFGYDPLFVPDGYDKTFAELPLRVKNTISHRAKAFGMMKKFLAGYLIETER